MLALLVVHYHMWFDDHGSQIALQRVAAFFSITEKQAGRILTKARHTLNPSDLPADWARPGLLPHKRRKK